MDETDTDAAEAETGEGEEPDTAGTEDLIDERVTAPMQSFGTREVTIGLVVLAVGLLVAFLLPLAF
ncbi:MAG: DUF7550 family protein [Halodesulfurarchaeum sp.]